jgi:hypothetical protein
MALKAEVVVASVAVEDRRKISASSRSSEFFPRLSSLLFEILCAMPMIICQWMLLRR